MKWIIQDSGELHYNWTALYKAVLNNNSSPLYCKLHELKKITLNEPCIVIGGDDFLEEASKNHSLVNGIFSYPDFFNVKSYMRLFEKDYLNVDTCFVKACELNDMMFADYFVRPLLDTKCFDGAVYHLPSEIHKITENCDKCYNNGQKCICVSSPKPIEKEWRAVIVDNKVVSTCRYVEDGQSKVSQFDCPEELLLFCDKIIKSANKFGCWVLDVCLSNGVLKILECNIFNASNFYDCDRFEIVKAVENLMASHE